MTTRSPWWSLSWSSQGPSADSGIGELRRRSPAPSRKVPRIPKAVTKSGTRSPSLMTLGWARMASRRATRKKHWCSGESNGLVLPRTRIDDITGSSAPRPGTPSLFFSFFFFFFFFVVASRYIPHAQCDPSRGSSGVTAMYGLAHCAVQGRAPSNSRENSLRRPHGRDADGIPVTNRLSRGCQPCSRDRPGR